MQQTIEGFELSRQQKSLWQTSHHSSTPSQCVIEIEGPLDRQALRRALTRIVGDHEILRTHFVRFAGMRTPLQVIGDEAELAWDEAELAEAAPAEQQRSLEALIERWRNEPIDLERDPLLRVCLVGLAPQRHWLLLTLPLICADSQTLSNMLDELAGRYHDDLSVDGDEAQPIQYVDFCQWQESILEDQDSATGRSYWAARAPRPYSRLWMADSQANAAPFQPGCVTVDFDHEALARLSQSMDPHGLSRAAFFLACWQVLLWRFIKDEPIVLGAVLSGRNFSDLQTSLGLFSQTVPFQSPMAGTLRFAELAAATERQLNDHTTWQDYYASAPTDASDASAAQPIIGFEFRSWAAPRATENLRFALAWRRSQAEPFGLALICSARESGVLGEFHYDAARIGANDVELVARSFATLFEAAAANPDALIGDLDVLGAADRRQLLESLAGPSAPAPQAPIHALIEAQAQRTPARTALVCGEQTLSYAELNARSNQIAHTLRQRGCRSETLVGLCVERSVDMIVGLLAILKAGGAYVPIDPDFPAARMRYVLASSGASLLLTQQRFLAQFAGSNHQPICLDQESAPFAGAPSTNLAPVATPATLAYVIYTSGSTGNPKGVGICHRSLVNYAGFICSRLGLDESPAAAPLHFATVSTIGADLGNTVVFAALVSGGCLHIIPSEIATDSNRFAAYAASQPIDVLKIVPSHLSSLLTTDLGAAILPRHTLVLGGEGFPPGLLRRINSLGPACAIINHYGPTETTIGSLVYMVDRQRDADRRAATLPIGSPISGTSVYILDERLNLVPPGSVGELFIGGVGLARGYAGRPELTAERFIPHGFSAAPGERLYKTGDRARLLPDGSIEFLGRGDAQVKIRGYRIELGEIEAAIRAYPDVQNVAVLAQEDELGQPRLAAYVAGAGADPASPDGAAQALESGLRRHLEERLPAAMIPSAFIFLAALPLSANGKIDRQALPALTQPQRRGRAAYACAQTETEQILVDIWEQVLGGSPLGIHDNFFALGGHSLLATQIMARVCAAFRIDIALPALFDTQTIAGLAQRVDLAQARAPMIGQPRLRPAAHGQPLPLSFAQQRLWFLEQFAAGSSYNNMPLIGLRLRGALDPQALGQAAGAIVERHEILRTVYRLDGDQPVQVVMPAQEIPVRLVDLTADRPEDQERQVRAIARAEAGQGFDLANGPLIRLTLIRLAEREHIVLLAQHHIVTDGWSMQITINEFMLLYRQFQGGGSAGLPELTLQYGDFAAWQREWLQGETLERLLGYWSRQLEGAPKILELPGDRPRPPVQTFNGSSVALSMPAPLVAAITQFSRDERATLYMTLLAGLKTLLYRYTDQTDLVVGSPIANRRQVELEGMLGVFINMLALRTQLDPGITFRQLVARVRATALGAFEHQDLPFEKLVDALQPTRDLSHTPLFQVSFVFNEDHRLADQLHAAGPAFELPGLDWEMVDTNVQSSRYDLTFISEDADGRSWVVEYNSDIFERPTVERLFQHFQNILQAAVATPDVAVAALPLISDADRTYLLETLNASPRPAPEEHGSLPLLIAAQARSTPDAIAVVAGAETLSYAGLLGRAEQLAGHLAMHGVGPGTLVGLCVERSPDMPVAILAILLAGGAYVPLDPAAPAERLAMIIRDSGLQVALVHGLTAGRHTLPVPMILNMTALAAAPTPAAASASIRPDHPAYVIYTSGSTGLPKGVMVSHANLRASTLARAETYATSPERFLLLSSFTFDSSVAGIFWTLSTGGALVLPPADLEQDLLRLPALLEEARITHLLCVPSLYAMLLEHAPDTALAALDTCIVAGETCPPELVAAHHARLPRTALFNEYGPTETTVWASVAALPAPAAGRVPIGRPVSSARIYILDAQGAPSPVGVAGELCIGGPGVAMGYLGRPALTAERFGPDPFGGIPGARLYRTGDRARWLVDGQLEYMGRWDQQVKVRGYRVELGEIEAVLRRHPAVGEAALVADTAATPPRLVAYVTASGAPQPTAAELRQHLLEQLPAYMVPAALTVLARLPLNAHGKVDRRALVEQAATAAAESVGDATPRTEAEATLAAIWADVLQRTEVGIHDNFFALGGDSILSIQVIVRARAAGLHLEPRQIFLHQTIAKLASVALAGPSLTIDQGLVQGPLPLTPIQHWFFDQDMPNPHHWNQTVLLEVEPTLDSASLEAIVPHLVRHHDALRMRFRRVETGWSQEYGAADLLPLIESVDLSSIDLAEQRTAIESMAAAAQAALSLTQGPLMRLTLFKLGPERTSRLLIVVHHMVVDAVSWRILLEDLQVAYKQYRAGLPIQFAPKTTSYKEWSERLEAYARSEELAARLPAWRDAGPRPDEALPRDLGGANSEASARQVTNVLQPAETSALLLDVPGAYRAQISEILLAALSMALAPWVAGPSITLNLEGHGRTAPVDGLDVSRTVGWFTSIFPLRLDLSGDLSPARAVQAVKARAAADSQRGFDYGVLRYLSPQGRRELTAPPAELSFNYLGQLDATFQGESGFRLAYEASGPDHSPQAPRAYLIDVNCWVESASLHIEWTYSEQIHQAATIERLAHAYCEALRSIIGLRHDLELQPYTPADFPGLRVDQQQLDSILGSIELDD